MIILYAMKYNFNYDLALLCLCLCVVLPKIYLHNNQPAYPNIALFRKNKINDGGDGGWFDG